MGTLTQSAISPHRSVITDPCFFFVLFVSFVVSFSPALAAEPTLARLAFWVPPKRRSA